jgi:hypothetical protein
MIPKTIQPKNFRSNLKNFTFFNEKNDNSHILDYPKFTLIKRLSFSDNDAQFPLLDPNLFRLIQAKRSE